MSVYKKSYVVAKYPAYTVVKRDTISNNGVVYYNLVARDKLITKKHLGTYTVGSVVSYALEYNENPIEEYNRCVANGHATHWINSDGATISNMKKDPYDVIEVDYGDVVMFEGVLFTIEKAPNNNLKLVAY